MATTFPQAIQTFPQWKNIDANDMPYVQAYQEAMRRWDFQDMQDALANIPNWEDKILTAEWFQTISDTVVAVQKYFEERYNPSLTIQSTQPTGGENGDSWWQIVGQT